MDKMTPRPRELKILDAALAAATAQGVAAEFVQHRSKRGTVTTGTLLGIGRGGRQVDYIAEVVPALTPATLGAAVIKLEHLGARALLVTEYVTPALADALKARGVSFLDTAGNAYLDQPDLFIWVKGQKPTTRPVAPEVGRAFQPTGLQVVFVLLCDPGAVNRPYRDLAAMAGVAHGTVGWVIPDLQRLGFVADIKGKRGTRRLFDLERLLGQWVDAYARVLRPRLLIGRYYIPTFEGWKDWPVAEHKAIWGSEPAGALLTNYLRPGELTLYADKLPGLLAARQKFTGHSEPGRTAIVEVRKKFWNFPGDPERPTIAPPVLVYADLLATGDARCIETAKLIYDEHVARLLAKG